MKIFELFKTLQSDELLFEDYGNFKQFDPEFIALFKRYISFYKGRTVQITFPPYLGAKSQIEISTGKGLADIKKIIEDENKWGIVIRINGLQCFGMHKYFEGSKANYMYYTDYQNLFGDTGTNPEQAEEQLLKGELEDNKLKDVSESKFFTKVIPAFIKAIKILGYKDFEMMAVLADTDRKETKNNRAESRKFVPDKNDVSTFTGKPFTATVDTKPSSRRKDIKQTIANHKEYWAYEFENFREKNPQYANKTNDELEVIMGRKDKKEIDEFRTKHKLPLSFKDDDIARLIATNIIDKKRTDQIKKAAKGDFERKVENYKKAHAVKITNEAELLQFIRKSGYLDVLNVNGQTYTKTSDSINFNYIAKTKRGNNSSDTWNRSYISYSIDSNTEAYDKMKKKLRSLRELTVDEDDYMDLRSKLSMPDSLYIYLGWDGGMIVPIETNISPQATI